MTTVRPNVFSFGEPDNSRKGEIQDFDMVLSSASIRTKVVAIKRLRDEGKLALRMLRSLSQQAWDARKRKI